MRQSEPKSSALDAATRPVPAGWGSRTSRDVASLLLELARAYRGFSFYREAAQQRNPLCERAHRALQSEIERAGPIEIERTPSGFEISGLLDRIETRGVVDAFRAALERHRIEHVAFSATLSENALHGFFDQLCRPTTRFKDAAAFARSLAARDSTGLCVNRLDDAALAPPRALDATPIHAFASLGSTHLETTPGLAFARNAAPEATADRSEASGMPAFVRRPSTADRALERTSHFAGPDDANAISAELEPDSSARDAMPPEPENEPVPTRETRHAPSGVDRDPLATPSGHGRGERLRARLIELDLTSDDSAYRGRADEILTWARELFESGLRDECYRAELVLADHAVGSGGRSESQARAAATSLSQLARGERLEDLIDRAIGDRGHAIRAAQVLLQLGADAAPALFARYCRSEAEEDPRSTAQLSSLMLTLGEIALPTLVASIRGQDDRRAQQATRLAGEMQSPTILPTLLEALRAPALARRMAAIQALSHLPGEASKQALEEALRSDLEEIAVAATRAVATSDGVDAVPTLLDALDVSLRSQRTALSRSLIEVLGRLGDERAVPRLSAVLERKPVIRRAHWHAAQLAAVDALAGLPTKEARRSIERAARHGATPVKARARAQLEAFSPSRDRP